MIILPKQEKTGEGVFSFGAAVKATAHPALDTAVAKELWHGFCQTGSDLEISHTEDWLFAIGEAEPLPVGEEKYTLHVTPRGITLAANDEKGLLWGFMTLLGRIEPVDLTEGQERFEVAATEIFDKPDLARRMIHYCVFPDTDLFFLHRLIRLSAVLKYTHIVLEFWGMLQLDCMAEISWPCAFTKEQVRPLIKEANDLGVEIIPMFNHWGHAAGSRGKHGRHVVLDQNPRLATLFSDDGWVWRIDSPAVRALFHKIRIELCELCGEGGYFHIGCDEAYQLHTVEDANALCDFLREVTDDLATMGRRPIIWEDMFLFDCFTDTEDRYECNCQSRELSDYLIERFDRRMVMADWQYHITKTPVKTAAYLASHGIDTLECPWGHYKGNVSAGIEGAKQQGLMGAMYTTWHTLEREMEQVAVAAALMWNKPTAARPHQATATLLRKCLHAGGDLGKAGWITEENK